MLEHDDNKTELMSLCKQTLLTRYYQEPLQGEHSTRVAIDIAGKENQIIDSFLHEEEIVSPYTLKEECEVKKLKELSYDIETDLSEIRFYNQSIKLFKFEKIQADLYDSRFIRTQEAYNNEYRNYLQTFYQFYQFYEKYNDSLVTLKSRTTQLIAQCPTHRFEDEFLQPILKNLTTLKNYLLQWKTLNLKEHLHSGYQRLHECWQADRVLTNFSDKQAIAQACLSLPEIKTWLQTKNIVPSNANLYFDRTHTNVFNQSRSIACSPLPPHNHAKHSTKASGVIGLRV